MDKILCIFRMPLCRITTYRRVELNPIGTSISSETAINSVLRSDRKKHRVFYVNRLYGLIRYRTTETKSTSKKLVVIESAWFPWQLTYFGLSVRDLQKKSYIAISLSLFGQFLSKKKFWSI